MVDASALEERLRELTERFDVPGASVAVLADGATTTAAAGSLNRDAGIEATTESLFQIGSITKLLTTAAVMRLVEREELDLDEPVVKHLPELTTLDPDAARAVTLRHLLTHSSGIDGDHFLDTGRGDDVLEKYVASCSDLPHQFAVGATHSYCNAGFGIAGRVLEVAGGAVWDDVLRAEVLEPLALERTLTLPEDALRHRVACGHVGEPGEVRLAPQWSLPRSCGPAGNVVATAADVVGFARAVLDAGDWLGAETRAEMLAPQVAVPNPYAMGAHWGVGWMLDEAVDGRRVVGHDGRTIGQSAALRVVPDAGVAVAVLLNGGGGASDVIDTVLREVLRDTAGVELRSDLAPVDDPGPHHARHAGTYRRRAETLELEPDGEHGLRLTATDTSHLAGLVDDEPVVIDLVPAADTDRDTYVGRYPGSERWSPFVFFRLDDTSFLHAGGRAFPRELEVGP